MEQYPFLSNFIFTEYEDLGSSLLSMIRFLPAAFIFLAFVVTLKFHYKTIEINLVNWRERQENIKKYCDSDKAILLKRYKFASEKIFQKKLVTNIVHVDSLRINWCLGTILKRKHFIFRNQN